MASACCAPAAMEVAAPATRGNKCCA
jgi:hypothetical protein